MRIIKIENKFPATSFLLLWAVSLWIGISIQGTIISRTTRDCNFAKQKYRKSKCQKFQQVICWSTTSIFIHFNIIWWSRCKEIQHNFQWNMFLIIATKSNLTPELLAKFCSMNREIQQHKVRYKDIWFKKKSVFWQRKYFQSVRRIKKKLN